MGTWGRRHRNPLVLYQFCTSYVTVIDVLPFSTLIAGFVVLCDSTSITSEVDGEKKGITVFNSLLLANSIMNYI